MSPPNGENKREGTDTVEKSFNTDEQEELVTTIARIFYFGDFSFNMARNPHHARK